MSSTLTHLRRNVLRAMAGLSLALLLLGVPVAVVARLRSTEGSVDLRVLWQQHRVTPEVALLAGGVLFVVLWSWFALTALAELVRVWPKRSAPEVAAARHVEGGPSGLVRAVVRFVVLSSVSAGALSGGLAHVTHADAPAAVEHVVVPGDSYWSIAEDQLEGRLDRSATPAEVWDLTQDLMDDNAARLGHRDPTLLLPGEVVVVPGTVDDPTVSPVPRMVSAPTRQPDARHAPPPSAPPTSSSVPSPQVQPSAVSTTVQTVAPDADPSTVVTVSIAAGATDTTSTNGSAPPAGLSMLELGHPASRPLVAGAALLAFGVLTHARRRRGRVLRSCPPGAQAEPPSFRAARLELQLRAMDSSERMARLDVALRSAAAGLAAQGSGVLAVVVDRMGEVRLHLSSPALPEGDLWRADLLRETWRLPAAVPLQAIAAAGRLVAFPCPALAQLGVTTDGADVFVDLEALGLLVLDTPLGTSIMSTIASSLAWSPWLEHGRVIWAADAPIGCPAVDVLTPGEAWSLIGTHRQAVVLSSPSTFRSRVEQLDEGWPPLIAFVDGGRPPGADAVVTHSGVGVVTTGPSASPFTLRLDGDAHMLEPLGIRLMPSVVDEGVLEAAAEIVEHAGVQPLAVVPDDVAALVVDESSAAWRDVARTAWTEPRWDILVTVLGQVSVQDRAGHHAQFEKAKAMELLVWLTQHRERPTRSAARSALWDLAVRDSTFANVVSDCRRGLGRLVPPPHGEEWVGRTLSDDLPLHPRVITDAELLVSRVDAARGLPSEAAIGVLRPGVELLHGMPFSGAGAGYLWVDGEGHTSSLVLLATGAAEQLAEHHLALGDVDGVFWATGQGLRVLPAHEQLIALRMRAHAMRGDMAGVRLEWEQYERALAVDSWSDDEPSPKLAALRRELLAPSASLRL